MAVQILERFCDASCEASLCACVHSDTISGLIRILGSARGNLQIREQACRSILAIANACDETRAALYARGAMASLCLTMNDAASEMRRQESLGRSYNRQQLISLIQCATACANSLSQCSSSSSLNRTYYQELLHVVNMVHIDNIVYVILYVNASWFNTTLLFSSVDSLVLFRCQHFLQLLLDTCESLEELRRRT